MKRHSLFETIKKSSKGKFYLEKLLKFKGDAKKQCTTKSSTLPTKILVNKTGIFNAKK